MIQTFINGNPLLGNSEVVRAADARKVEEELAASRASELSWLTHYQKKVRDMDYKIAALTTENAGMREDLFQQAFTSDVCIQQVAGWKEAREYDLMLIGKLNREITALTAEKLDWTAKAARLTAENAGMREALKEIRKYGCNSDGTFTGICDYGCDTPDIADKALRREAT